MTVSRIAVGVDGYPEGRDAVALGAAIASVTGAELMLVAVHLDLLVVLPSGMDWKSLRTEAESMLRDVRDLLAPGARTVAESDLSISRALRRIVRRDHRDLLALGSSRHAAQGRVRIGKRTRQLLCHFECALAIAPRGLHSQLPSGYGGSALDMKAALSRRPRSLSRRPLRLRREPNCTFLGWSTTGSPCS